MKRNLYKLIKILEVYIMLKFEDKVIMIVFTVILLGLGVCIGIGITELIMLTECFTYIAIALVCAISLMALGFWTIIATLAGIDEVEED